MRPIISPQNQKKRRGDLFMYRLKYIKRRKKTDRLGLYNEEGYITSVVVEKKPTRHDLLQLQIISGLSINWEAIWDRFQRKVIGKHCEICGGYFEAKKEKQKFCSEECRKEGRKRRQKEYYENNRLKILKKATKRMRFYRKQKHDIIREHIRNIGPLPEGFKQIDDRPNDLGESNLRQHRNDDFEKELDLIEKEMDRLFDR